MTKLEELEKANRVACLVSMREWRLAYAAAAKAKKAEAKAVLAEDALKKAQDALMKAQAEMGGEP